MKISLSTAFSLVFGIVVLIAMGTIFFFSAVNARNSLIEQLANDFDLKIAAIDSRIRDYMLPAEYQVEYLKRFLVLDHTISSDNRSMAEMLRASISSSPQITAVAFIRPDTSSVRVERDPARVYFDDLNDRKDLIDLVDKARSEGPDGQKLGWSEPLFSSNIGHTIIVYRSSVWRGNEFLGVLFAATDLTSLSRFTSQLSNSIGQTVFILHDRTEVIAHPNLLDGHLSLRNDVGTIQIDQLGDASLDVMWSSEQESVISSSQMQNSMGHIVKVEGEDLVFIYSTLDSFGEKPWLFGYHFNADQEGGLETEFWRYFEITIGLIFALTLIGGVLGYFFSRPIRQITEGATGITNLKLHEFKPIGKSFIKEIDNASASFNSMVSGIDFFMKYVPRKVVENVLRGGRRTTAVEERELTMLFVDIEGFTRLSENLSPRETATLLGEHFQILSNIIYEFGGTIDKFTGDGLLAFWGAPDHDLEHGLNAVRAAKKISEEIAKDNSLKRDKGLEPIKVRMGLHSGKVVVGDIGSSERINYTVVGDAVNLASRIESLGKDHSFDDAVVLFSEATQTFVNDELNYEMIGDHTVTGRDQAVKVFRLI